MQLWIIHSLLALIGFTGIYILIKSLTRFEISSIILNFWFFTLTAIGFLVLAFNKKEILSVPKASLPFFLLLTLSAVFGNYYSVKAYQIAPNPGYVAAIISSAVIFLTIFSIFAFGSELTWLKGFGILLTTTGVAILALA
ncbi:MAG: EamA family transporter [Bdellovibrionota bacterium]